MLETYHSIKNQSFSDWEWLVTDDCSTDNSLELLENIKKFDSRVKVISNKTNSGAAFSRNRSLSEVNGEYIAFIDSDDIWNPYKLEKQLMFMESHQISFSFTAYDLIDEKGNYLNKIIDYSNSDYFSYEDMLRKKATLGCSTVMLKRSAFPDLRMPLLRTGQDYATWLKLLKTGNNAYLLKEVLTSYRIRKNSISRNKLKKARRQWQIYRDIEKLGYIKSIICFFYYVKFFDASYFLSICFQKNRRKNS